MIRQLSSDAFPSSVEIVDGINLNFFSNSYVRQEWSKRASIDGATSEAAREARRLRRLSRNAHSDEPTEIPAPITDDSAVETPREPSPESVSKRGVSFASQLEDVRSIPARKQKKKSTSSKKHKDTEKEKDKEKEKPKEKEKGKHKEKSGQVTPRHTRAKSSDVAVSERTTPTEIPPLVAAAPASSPRTSQPRPALPSARASPAIVTHGLFQVGEEIEQDSPPETVSAAAPPSPGQELSDLEVLAQAIAVSELRQEIEQERPKSPLLRSPVTHAISSSPPKEPGSPDPAFAHLSVPDSFRLGEAALPSTRTRIQQSLLQLQVDTASEYVGELVIAGATSPSFLPRAESTPSCRNSNSSTASSVASSTTGPIGSGGASYGFDSVEREWSSPLSSGAPSPAFPSRAGVKIMLQRRSRSTSNAPVLIAAGGGSGGTSPQLLSASLPVSPDAYMRQVASPSTLLQTLNSTAPKRSSLRHSGDDTSLAHIMPPSSSSSPAPSASPARQMRPPLPMRSLSDTPSWLNANSPTSTTSSTPLPLSSLPPLQSDAMLNAYAAQLSNATAHATHLHHLDLGRRHAEVGRVRLLREEAAHNQTPPDDILPVHRRSTRRVARARPMHVTPLVLADGAPAGAAMTISPTSMMAVPAPVRGVSPPTHSPETGSSPSDMSPQTILRTDRRRATAALLFAQYGWDSPTTPPSRSVSTKLPSPSPTHRTVIDPFGSSSPIVGGGHGRSVSAVMPSVVRSSPLPSPSVRSSGASSPGMPSPKTQARALATTDPTTGASFVLPPTSSPRPSGRRAANTGNRSSLGGSSRATVSDLTSALYNMNRMRQAPT